MDMFKVSTCDRVLTFGGMSVTIERRTDNGWVLRTTHTYRLSRASRERVRRLLSDFDVYVTSIRMYWPK